MDFEQKHKYTLFIGLTTKNFIKLNKNFVMSVTEKTLNSAGIIGFNSNNQLISNWDKNREGTFKVSFINTFGLKEETILKAIEKLKVLFNQDCILLEKTKNVLHCFV